MCGFDPESKITFRSFHCQLPLYFKLGRWIKNFLFQIGDKFLGLAMKTVTFLSHSITRTIGEILGR